MTITSKFNSYCTACRCSIPMGTQVNWVRGVKGVTHVSSAACAAAKAVAPRPAPTGVVANGAPIARFLTAARERGLKFPKARFLSPAGQPTLGDEIRLSLAGAGSKYPGSVQVKSGRGEWLGRIEPNGNVAGQLARNAALLAKLDEIAQNPAEAAKDYGALMCRCSFCDRSLTDEGSVEVGYGPICAEKFGLPHVAKGTKKLQPVAASAATAGTELFAVAFEEAV